MKKQQRVRTTASTPLRIRRNKPDFNSLENETLQLLSGDKPLPPVVDNEVIASVLLGVPENVATFALPIGSITSSPANPEFYNACHRLRNEWFHRLRQVFGRSTILRRRIKEEPDLLRRLKFTGMMLINGQPIHPHRWNERGIDR